MECIYYLVNRKWCDLPEIVASGEARLVLPAVADLNGCSPMIAVVCCGNPNRSDDGAGPHIFRLLRERCRFWPRHHDIRLLDAGTDGMAVMFAARDCDSLIVVDACRFPIRTRRDLRIAGRRNRGTAPTRFIHA